MLMMARDMVVTSASIVTPPGGMSALSTTHATRRIVDLIIDIDYYISTVDNDCEGNEMTTSVCNAAVTYLTSRGFVHKSHLPAPEGRYVHPIGVSADVWDKKWTDRVEVEFSGPTVERPRPVKYSVENLNALFNRAQRILLAAARDAARRRKAIDDRVARRNKIVDAIREFGVVDILPDNGEHNAVTIEYHGRATQVSLNDNDQLTVRVGIGYDLVSGRAGDHVSLNTWTKIVDIATNYEEQ